MTFKRKTLLIDLDSIVFNIDEAWYPEYNRRYNDDLTVEKVHSWDIHKYARQDLLGVGHPLHPIYNIVEEPGFFLKLNPLPGAVDGMEALVDDGHNVLIVSAGFNGASLADKHDSVKKHLPFFNLKKLILTHEKAAVKGDIIFDDGPHNIKAYREAWPDARIATIEYPYNLDALKYASFVAGSYRDTAEAWDWFVKYVEATP